MQCVSDDDIVLESSTLRAYLLNEPGAAGILFLLECAVMSAVNMADVRTRLIDLRKNAQSAGQQPFDLIRRIETFTEEDAIATAELRPKTSHAGLSLGDRACLVLAVQLGPDVYSAVRPWAGVNVGCTIHLIR